MIPDQIQAVAAVIHAAVEAGEIAVVAPVTQAQAAIPVGPAVIEADFAHAEAIAVVAKEVIRPTRAGASAVEAGAVIEAGTGIDTARQLGE